MSTHLAYDEEDVPGGVPVKMWTRGVPVEDQAKRQLTNAARLPIVFTHIAAMPDVHFGIGATVGSVIPTLKAIIPAAVGVDIGCGMMAVQDHAARRGPARQPGPLRAAIERAVPHGRSPGSRDPGAWGKVPGSVDTAWAQLEPEFTELCRDYPKLEKTNHASIWARWARATTSSRSAWTGGLRVVHAALGLARRGQRHRHDVHRAGQAGAMRNNANLPDRDLAYFEEGSRYFGDYVRAVGWAQEFAASTAR